MNRILLLMVGSIAVLALVGGLLIRGDRSFLSGATEERELVLHCAASNRAVMESIRQAYEEEFGRSVQVQYGPSQTLLSSIEVSGMGDLYLPADDSYLDVATEKGLIAETLSIARMRAVIAVPAGNPKSIDSFDDLLRDDVRVVLANPETAAIGKVTKQTLLQLGRWQELEEVNQAFRATVTEVANDVAIGAADAGIVYDAVLSTYDNVNYVVIPELAEAASDIAVGLLGSSTQPTKALHFARYLSAEDRGLEHYETFGFQVCSAEAQPVMTSEGFRWGFRSQADSRLTDGVASRRDAEPSIRSGN
jgi:molybdate transport system substrate-binding protein